MKTIVVTGASFGIGKATAQLLSENNFNVIAVSRNIEELNKIKNKNIEAYQLDITDVKKINDFKEFIKNKNVVGLINNAGGGIYSENEFLNEDTEIWKKVYDLNVVGAINMTQATAPEIIKNGGGNIVVVTSIAGHYVYKNSGSYSVAKHAEAALSDLLRIELYDKNIRITEIISGNVNSRGDKDPGVSLRPEDVAEAIRWAIMVPEHVDIEKINIMHINNLSR